MQRIFLILLVLLLQPLQISIAIGQTSEQSASYFSQVDQDITIRKISVLPIIDNIDGIYSRPLENHLINLVKTNHHFDFVELNSVGNVLSAAELEEHPETVSRVAEGLGVDGLWAASINKGPAGISIRLNFFMKKDGKLLLQETLNDYPKFEIADLKEQLKIMYAKALGKFPYSGLVMSRQQNRVTLNIGKTDGLMNDQILTVVQITKLKRHPKFGFLISTEKEILGKIKVQKVEETLSFGTILTERESGVIKKLSKISSLDFQTYDDPGSLDTSGTSPNPDHPESEFAFGKNPKEWLPIRTPTFGSVTLKLGLGSFNNSINLTGVDNYQASSTFYTRLTLNAELWMHVNWFLITQIEQGIAPTKNPRTGSAPGELNHAIGKYTFAAAYNSLLRDDFWGPKLQIRFGISNYVSTVDDSQPRSFSSVNYSGVLLGVAGESPITPRKDWVMGVNFNMILLPHVSEMPQSSGGSPSNTINDFSFFLHKKIAENMRITGSLDFSIYSTTFSGPGLRSEVATSMSQRSTTLNGGAMYMF